MKISGRTQPLYPQYKILDALAVIKRLGFDGVEICLEADELAPGTLDLDLVNRIKDQVTVLGLTPHVVGYHVDYIYSDDLYAATRKAIQLTRSFGTNILIFSGTHQRQDDEGSWDRMITRTRQLTTLAEDEGVILAQEFEPGFIVGSTADLLRLFSEISSPNLAANLDLGHVFLCDPDPLQAIRQVGEKIVHVHVENMRTGVHDHELPQDGDMDLAMYLKTLQGTGFKGGMALDLYRHDYQTVAPAALAYLKNILG